MLSANLAYWMGKFVLEVCKKDGKEYLPKSWYSLVCCIKRYYEQNGVFNVNPLSSSDARFGNFMMQRWRDCTDLGWVPAQNRRNIHITPDGEALLWTSQQFGMHCAMSLINTVYYYNCKVFGLCSYDEHGNLQCNQYQRKVDEQGWVYLDCAHMLCNLGIMRMCNTISRLRKFSDCAEQLYLYDAALFHWLVQNRYWWLGTTKSAQWSPDPFPRERVGFGHETALSYMYCCNPFTDFSNKATWKWIIKLCVSMRAMCCEHPWKIPVVYAKAWQAVLLLPSSRWWVRCSKIW